MVVFKGKYLFVSVRKFSSVYAVGSDEKFLNGAYSDKSVSRFTALPCEKE